MRIRGLYNDLHLVTATPFAAIYARTTGAFLRKRFRADPLAGPILYELARMAGAVR